MCYPIYIAGRKFAAGEMGSLKAFALLILFCFALSAQNGAGSFADLSARASAARQASDVPHAIALYRQALQLNPKWEEGWWFLGTLLYDSDQYAPGRDALRHFVGLQPNAAPALGLLGLCEFETGDYPESLKHIERSLSLGTPAEPQMDQVLRYHEAMLLTRTGAFDKALQEYVWFVRKGARSESILLGIGLAALRTPLLPKDVSADRQNLFLTAGQASVYTITGDLANAQQTFLSLLERFPDSPNVHYVYGVFVLGADPDRAIDEFKLELKILPSNAAAGAMLAWVLLRRGDFKVALPYAEKAVRDAPGFPTAQLVFGRLLVETGAVDRGIEHLQTAEKLDPANLEVHLGLVTAYSRIGRTQDARRERRTSMELSAENASIAQR